MNPCYDPDQCLNKSCDDCELTPPEKWLGQSLTEEQQEELLADIQREMIELM